MCLGHGRHQVDLGVVLIKFFDFEPGLEARRMHFIVKIRHIVKKHKSVLYCNQTYNNSGQEIKKKQKQLHKK